MADPDNVMAEISQSSQLGRFLKDCQTYQKQKAKQIGLTDSQFDRLGLYRNFIDREAKEQYFKAQASQFREKLQWYDMEDTTKTGNIRGVISVASTDYLQWLRGEHRAKIPDLGVLQSSVPEVRRLMRHFPAEASYHAYGNHIRHQLRKVLEGSKRIAGDEVSRLYLKQADFKELREVFLQWKTNLLSALRRKVTTLLSTQLQQISKDTLMSKMDRRKWEIKAFLATCESLPWNSFRKVIRSRGIKGPRESITPLLKGRYTNGNAEISSLFRDDVREWRQSMQPQTAKMTSSMQHIIEGAPIDLRNRLKRLFPEGNRNMVVALEEWDNRSERFSDVFDQFPTAFDKCIQDTYNYATDERDINGMMINLLNPAYEKTAAVQGGTDYLQRARLAFRRALVDPIDNSPGLVESVTHEIKRYFTDDVEGVFKNLETDISEELDSFDDALLDFGRTTVPMDKAMVKVRKELKREVPKLMGKCVQLEARFMPRIKEEAR